MVGMFERSLDRLSSVSLEEISGEASLMRRYDHKYATTDVRANDFIATLIDDWRVLRIGREPSPLYRTTYFDDDRCRTYRDHVQGRRPRFKIRSRTYQNGASFLEVKMKTGRGQTDKRRIARPDDALHHLLEPELDWLHALLPDFDPRSLRPTLKVESRRITLHSSTLAERVTIDHSMRVTNGEEWTPLLDGGVVVETKSETFRSRAFHLLADLDVRPVSFSKYCAGLSVVDASVHPRIRIDAERALHVGVGE